MAAKDLPKAPVTQPVVRSSDPSPSAFGVDIGDRVHFDANGTRLTGEARNTLLRQASWLVANGGYSVVVEGHADERGTLEYNLALGDTRANTVREFLIANGVAATRIRTVTYGKERPSALGHNEAAWASNRRAVTVLK